MDLFEKTKAFLESAIDKVKSFLVQPQGISIKFLKSKVRSILSKKDIKKVGVIDMKRLINEIPNQSALEELFADGYTLVIVPVNMNGKITTIEAIREKKRNPEIDKLLGSEGMVVITK